MWTTRADALRCLRSSERERDMCALASSAKVSDRVHNARTRHELARLMHVVHAFQVLQATDDKQIIHMCDHLDVLGLKLYVAVVGRCGGSGTAQKRRDTFFFFGLQRK